MRKLTAQSRGIIYLALFLSGLVIVSVLLYFFTVQRNGGMNPHTAWVAIGIILLAVLAFGFVFYARTRRTRYTKKLNPDYFAAYEHVSDILQGSTLGMMERKEVLLDVLDLLLQAQQDNRPVSDVIGVDIEAFVAKVQHSFGYRNRFLYHIMNGVQYSIAYLFFIQVVIFLRGMGQISFFEAAPDISMVVLLCSAAFLVVPFIRYYVRRQKVGIVVLIPIGLLIVFIGVMELSRAYLYHIQWIKTMLDGRVVLIPSWGILFLWIGAAATAQFIKWLQRRISINRLA